MVNMTWSSIIIYIRDIYSRGSYGKQVMVWSSIIIYIRDI